MRLRIYIVIFLGLSQIIPMHQAMAVTPISYESFSSSSPAIEFSGQSNDTIKVDSSSVYNFGSGDFTIDWWQKASRAQVIYPRLFQFGGQAGNSDGFAVSEEGGSVYFWLDSRTAGSRGGPRVSVGMPDEPDVWHHYAVVRNGLEITIYLDGISQNSYVEAPVDPSDPFAAPSSLATPADVGTLDLLIGGSNDSSLGAFNGKMTGFEIFRGARWSSNFSPPTTYTSENCFASSGATCTLERLLFIYPHTDFTQSGNQLLNLVNDQPINVSAGVTYFSISNNQSTDSMTVTLEPNYNGQICGDFDLQSPICSETSTANNAILELSNQETNTIYINPDPNFQTDSITITPINGESITVNPYSSTFEVIDSQNNSHFLRIYSDGELLIPPGMASFSISAIFNPERIKVELRNSSHGSICVNLGLGESACADSTTATLERLKASQFNIYFTPINGYSIETLTITPQYSDSISISASVDTFTVNNLDSEPRIFSWYLPDGDLTVPSDFRNFSISAVFSPMPNNDPVGGIYAQSRSHFSPVLFADSMILDSSDPDVDNDYRIVRSVILELNYYSNNPFVDNHIRQPLSCRFYLDVESSNLHSALFPEIPSMDHISEFCSDYHVSQQITNGKLYLQSSVKPTNYEEVVIDQANILEVVDIELESPPGINRLLPGNQVNFGEEIIVDPSNFNNAVMTNFEILSSEEFIDGRCGISVNISDGYTKYPQFIVNVGGADFLKINVPTLEQINTSCGSFFRAGKSSLNQSVDHLMYIQIADPLYQGEQSSAITLKALNVTTQNPINPTRSQVIVTPQLPIEDTETLDSNFQSKNEQEQKSNEKPNSTSGESEKENSLSDKWCTKKGIWIYTISGKLQMCDPKNSTALEIKACAGKVNTPTYPWIFRAQRFYSGEIPTKSGTKLYNPVFFFKGLAISGAMEVSSEPCSAGSVFIPMKYSKTILEFARREKPLIWVKAA